MSSITPSGELPSPEHLELRPTPEWENEGYEAQVVDVWQSHYRKPMDGGEFLLDVPEMNQRLTYHAKSYDSNDAGMSLKLICHFLLHELSPMYRSKHLRVLIGRYVIVKVRRIVRDGLVIPIIVGFGFSEQQFFSHRSSIKN